MINPKVNIWAYLIDFVLNYKVAKNPSMSEEQGGATHCRRNLPE
jgi:hypothetical protein